MKAVVCLFLLATLVGLALSQMGNPTAGIDQSAPTIGQAMFNTAGSSNQGYSNNLNPAAASSPMGMGGYGSVHRQPGRRNMGWLYYYLMNQFW